MPNLVRTVFAIGACIATNAALACSCPVLPMETLVDEAETILIVRIVRIEDAMAVAGKSVWLRYDDAAPPYSKASDYGLRAEFTITRPLKQTGSLPDRLRTGYGGGDCGVELMPGNDYLVLTDADGAVTLCSGSQQIGFQGGISCPMQAFVASIERRIADRTTRIAPAQDGEYASRFALDSKVTDALNAGRSSFDAKCGEPDHD